MTKSLLVDLPVHKARNSYVEIYQGVVRLREGEDGRHKQSDKFNFLIFRINSRYVDSINEILLDNTWLSTTIVFASKSSFLATLERYLINPNSSDKCVTGGDDDLRLNTLEKLAAWLQSTGSKKGSSVNNIIIDEAVDYNGLIGYHVAIHRWMRLGNCI